MDTKSFVHYAVAQQLANVQIAMLNSKALTRNFVTNAEQG
jgi:hypothetical protein